MIREKLGRCLRIMNGNPWNPEPLDTQSRAEPSNLPRLRGATLSVGRSRRYCVPILRLARKFGKCRLPVLIDQEHVAGLEHEK